MEILRSLLRGGAKPEAERLEAASGSKDNAETPPDDGAAAVGAAASAEPVHNTSSAAATAPGRRVGFDELLKGMKIKESSQPVQESGDDAKKTEVVEALHAPTLTVPASSSSPSASSSTVLSIAATSSSDGHPSPLKVAYTASTLRSIGTSYLTATATEKMGKRGLNGGDKESNADRLLEFDPDIAQGFVDYCR